ncbi:MAG: Gfo/Idh/MocA family oxidoreductase [Coriobacteriia bacterium]|nr:Gfo/Idh/MocA family oxidoreductase [Coriobacteriia bacterium]MDO9108155.1 Gfo/Idh/MocA family oxidoreductase [Coriobacteriia bacterium]
MGEVIRVAIVGGGRAATPLIKELMGRPFIEIVGIADVDPNSSGAELARANGVFYCEHASVLAAKASEIDVILELSGDPAVKPALKDAFQAQGNRSTIIVQDLVARMIMSLVSGADELIESVHPDDRGIG